VPVILDLPTLGEDSLAAVGDPFDHELTRHHVRERLAAEGRRPECPQRASGMQSNGVFVARILAKPARRMPRFHEEMDYTV
jgi:hypothetical protein